MVRTKECIYLCLQKSTLYDILVTSTLLSWSTLCCTFEKVMTNTIY
jgi:hypothetical protein